jgi:hypothetical protein
MDFLDIKEPGLSQNSKAGNSKAKLRIGFLKFEI